jgi:hypothetical protein
MDLKAEMIPNRWQISQLELGHLEELVHNKERDDIRRMEHDGWKQQLEPCEIEDAEEHEEARSSFGMVSPALKKLVF